MKPDSTLRDLVEALAAEGDRDAIISVQKGKLERRSAVELARAARRLAAGLLDQGFRAGDAAAIWGPNSAEWVIARLAIGVAGGVAVAIDDLSPAKEVAAAIGEAECRHLFTTRTHHADLRKHGLGREVQCFALDRTEDAAGLKSWKSLVAGAGDEAHFPALSSDAPAMLLFTSGTTGAPKSFLLTSRHVAANVHALSALGLVGPGDRVLLPLPLHHAYPLVVGLVTGLAAGAAIVLPEAVTARPIRQALKAARVTIVVGVPRLYTALLAGIEAQAAARGALVRLPLAGLLAVSRAALRLVRWPIGRALFARLRKRVGPDLRLMISGGAKLEAATIWRLEALGWEVYSGYGLAETASVFTANRPDAKRIGSEGLPLCGELRIAEPDSAGMGEIQLRGPNVLEEYRNNDEANRTSFTSDGWFRTGDLGYRDRAGYLYVTGRTKEVIVLGGGKKVFPEDLERVYGASELIREIAVLEREGTLVALVLPKATRADGGGKIEDAIRAAVADAGRSLPAYQHLAGFALARAPLPRTRLGKYRRFLLPDLYEKASRGEAPPASAEVSAEDRALLASSPAREIWEVLTHRYSGRPLSLDANPQLDLGIDSLEAMALVLELEARLKTGIAEEAVTGAASVRELLEAASTQAPAEAEPGKAALEPHDLGWLVPRPRPLALLGDAMLAVNRAVMRRLFGLKARGLSQLPEGAFVITPNHVSDLDPLAVAAALPSTLLRRTYWGGIASRLFDGPVRRVLSRAAHIFPVDERRPSASIALGVEVVKRGNVLIWFPEEWRSPTGELQTFRAGIGVLLHETGVPAVPALIRGTFAAMPRERRFPRRAKIDITFGRPHSPEELAKRGKGENEAQRIADGLQASVAELAVADEKRAGEGMARAA